MKNNVEPIRRLLNDGVEANEASEKIKEEYLRSLNKTFAELDSLDVSQQDLFTAILTIEKTPEMKLENGLELRHKLFSENQETIELVTKFLKDRTMTLDLLK